MSYDLERERREAIEAGERALQSLYAAYDQLKGARNWGIVDMLGGGFLTTLIKRTKMDNARRLMEQARFDLQAFGRELSDIHISLEMDGLTGFFDYYDNFFADLMVQQQIRDAGMRLEDAINRVESLLSRLKGQD